MLASSSPGGPSPSSTPATTTTTSSAAPPDTAVGPPAGAPSSLQQQVQQHQQQQQSQHQQQQQVGPSLGLPSDAMNSMSVGQLKAAAQLSKPKPTQYDFRYEDSDTLMNELQEFFSYYEAESFQDELGAFEVSFKGEWTSASLETRTAYIDQTLTDMSDPDERLNARYRLSYLFQGVFAETTSPEQQLHLVIENCRLARKCDGLARLVRNLHEATARMEAMTEYHFPDPAGRTYASEAEKEVLTESHGEISQILGLLYFLVEVNRGDEELGREMMAMDPPLPVYLMDCLTPLKDKQIKERDVKGYPAKRLSLLLWKVLLACLGGIRDVGKVAKLSRELAGLSPAKSDWFGFTKATPTDIRQFHSETTVKYPTFAPEPFKDGPAPDGSALASALAPIPIRPHYHAPPSANPDVEVFSSLGRPFGGFDIQPASYGALPATPAPSPPPSPKPKKQMWQTDPLRPFVFPFSRMNQRSVPFAIDEADKLYKQHVHVSLGLYQLWKEREEFLKEELGLGLAADEALNLHGEKREIEEEAVSDAEVEDEGPPRDKVGSEFREKEREARAEEEAAKAEGDLKKAKAAREKIDSLVKLERVEAIYRGVLSAILPGAVIALLKLILATLQNPAIHPSTNPYGPPASVVSPGGPDHGDGFEFPQDAESKPPPTLEEIDVLRDREITAKCVSATLILLLKWFKCSHILKFQHLCQLLFDMNCPLILCKTFTNWDTLEAVKTKTEREDANFFRYCYLHFSKNPQDARPEDVLSVAPKARTVVWTGVTPSHPGAPTDHEVELISDYSWRNFFSAINRIKVLQKLLKGRTERIHQFNQYKTFTSFKRMLKVAHPMFQLQCLKIIKSQIPHLGKKWKQQNMKIVTAIYLNCRPDLRDEWLTQGMEQDELDASGAQEQALRSLVRYYHAKHYASYVGPYTGGPSAHRRSQSHAQRPSLGAAGNHHPSYSSLHHHGRPASSPSQPDVDLFPPNRSHPPTSSHPPHMLPDDLMDSWQHEYDDVLDDVFASEDAGADGEGGGLHSGWGPLSHALAGLNLEGGGSMGHSLDGWRFLDGEFSDSESSIGSIGELGDDARFGSGDNTSEEDEDGEDRGEGEDDGGEAGTDENVNNWEHLSNATLSAMPRSPTHHPRRSSSGGSPLRPVMKGNGVDAPEPDEEPIEDEEEEAGPMPRGPGAGEGGSVDEVEFLYGE